MATVEAAVEIAAAPADVWELYFDADRWPSWVDGFGRVDAADGYPEQDGTLVWSSVAAGRGSVRERVIAHEPRTLHRIAFSDPESAGELTTRFAVEGDGTRVTLELEYRLASGGPLTWVTDRVFVRSQMRESLRRTLARYRLEVEDLAG